VAAVAHGRSVPEEYLKHLKHLTSKHLKHLTQIGVPTYSSCAQIGVPASVGEWMWGGALELDQYAHDAAAPTRRSSPKRMALPPGQEAVVALADALKQKRTLQTLTLHGNATLTTLQLRRPRSGWLPPLRWLTWRIGSVGARCWLRTVRLRPTAAAAWNVCLDVRGCVWGWSGLCLDVGQHY